MTDNQRLARVLEILARVAAKGDPLPEKVYLAVVSIGSYFRFGEVTSLQTSELIATEAARLAGVPLDGWYTSEPKYGKQYILTIKDGDIVIAMFDRYQWWAGEEQQYRLDDVLAWRPLPEPYQAREVQS